MNRGLTGHTGHVTREEVEEMDTKITVMVWPTSTDENCAAVVECTQCGLVAVDTTSATHATLGSEHLFEVHGLGAQV